MCVPENAGRVYTVGREALTTLLTIKSISQAPQEDGIVRGKGSLLYGRGSNVQARCPRGKAPLDRLNNIVYVVEKINAGFVRRPFSLTQLPLRYILYAKGDCRTLRRP